MKTLILLIVLTISVNCFGQKRQSVGLLINPGRLGLEEIYTSKPIKSKISIVQTLATGIFYPSNAIGSIRSYEIGLGISFPIKTNVANFELKLIPTFNTIPEKYSEISKFSFEIGTDFNISKKISILFMINPFIYQLDKLNKNDNPIIDTELGFCYKF